MAQVIGVRFKDVGKIYYFDQMCIRDRYYVIQYLFLYQKVYFHVEKLQK